MNKAFVREPEFDGRAYCPRCGALGTAVGPVTLDAQIRPESRRLLTDAAWFCPFPRCDVAYFNLFEATVPVSDLKEPVYPKDPSAPLCPCFGFTHEDIDADIQDEAPTRIRMLLEKSKSSAAQCQTRAPDGRCCLREVQRLYMQQRGG